MTDQELLEKLARDFGFTVWDMREYSVIESVVPAICPDCSYTTEMEPDQDKGWCEGCEAPKCKSCLILAGLI